MKNVVRFLAVVLALAVVFPAAGDVPDFITYSGRLTDGAGGGQSLVLDLTLALHDEPWAGEVLWQQDYPKVTVVDGYFTVMLDEGVLPVEGTSVAVRDVILAQDVLWVSVSVEGGPELEPRTAIGSTPFAVRAGSAGSLGWNSQESKAVVSVSGGAVGIGISNTTAALHVKGEVKSEVDGTEYFMVPKGAIIMWSGGVDQVPPGWALCDGTNETPDLRDRFIVAAGGAYPVEDTGGAAAHKLTVDEMPGHTHAQNGHNHTQNSHNHGQNAHGHSATTGHQSKGHTHKANQTMGSVGHNKLGDQQMSAGPGTDFWNHKHYSTTSGISANHSHAVTVSNKTATNKAVTATNKTATATNKNTGGGSAHENRPPYFALAFIMRL